jgi:hypothetical protein
VLKLLQILNKFDGNLIVLTPAIPPPILWKFMQSELGLHQGIATIQQYKAGSSNHAT